MIRYEKTGTKRTPTYVLTPRAVPLCSYCAENQTMVALLEGEVERLTKLLTANRAMSTVTQSVTRNAADRNARNAERQKRYRDKKALKGSPGPSPNTA